VPDQAALTHPDTVFNCGAIAATVHSIDDIARVIHRKVTVMADYIASSIC
jgi:hypothetical protein